MALTTSIRTRSTTTRGTEICNFGVPSPLDVFFSPVDFSPFSPGLLCNLVRERPQNVEKIARFSGGEKSVESCHVCDCHGLFGPESNKLSRWSGLERKGDEGGWPCEQGLHLRAGRIISIASASWSFCGLSCEDVFHRRAGKGLGPGLKMGKENPSRDVITGKA